MGPRARSVTPRRGGLVVAAIVALVTAFAAGGAWGTNPLVDVEGNTHANNIDAIYDAGITLGCDGTHYCPADLVRRDQMASFLARGLGLSSGTTKNFPKANARSQAQAYCAIARANPASYPVGPCLGGNSKVDTSPNVGTFSSIAIGRDGVPVISYYDAANQDLKVVLCANIGCTQAEGAFIPNDFALDSTGNVGQHSSIAISSSGYPVISYYDRTNGDLKVLLCSSLSCATRFSPVVVDSVGDVGLFTSIAIGTDGFPVISYYDETNDDVKFVHCLDERCSIADPPSSFDTENAAGQFSSIAIGSDGFPIFVYFDDTNDDLRAVHCLSVGCTLVTAPISLTSDGSVGSHASLAIGTDGFPIVSYRDTTNGELRVVHCTTVSCAGRDAPVVLDSAGESGHYSSIAMGLDGLPAVSHYDLTNGDLRFVHCSSRSCSAMDPPVELDTFGDVGWHSSLAVGIDGVPVVSYYDVTGSSLNVARPPVS